MDSTSTQAIRVSPSTYSRNCSKLANSVMVPYTDPIINSMSTSIAQGCKQCAPTTQFGGTTSTGKQTSTDGLSFVREYLSHQEISRAVQGTLPQSWRSGTQKQYQVYFSKWESYTRKWKVDPFHPTISEVLHFLQNLYSALNTARSSLSSFIILDGNLTIGTHPLVQLLMKGVFQARPAVQRYTSTWDTSVVQLYLKGLHPATCLTLQRLTQKLVMLCALVTGQRCQSLHLMNLGSMHMDTDNSYIFRIQGRN